MIGFPKRKGASNVVALPIEFTRKWVCPIPSCFTEWMLGIATFGMGIWVQLSLAHSTQLKLYFKSLPDAIAWHLILPSIWSATLVTAGLFQILSLWKLNPRYQHAASIFGFLAWGLVGVGFYNAGLTIVLWPVCVFLGAEFIIALMLRTAKV
jgi:hypothetical protein